MAIEKYVLERRDAKLSVALRQPGWDTVYDFLDDAKRTYEAKAEKSFLRRRLREPVIAEHAKAAFEALPTDDGIGLIKAGLLIVFNVRIHSRGRAQHYSFLENCPQDACLADMTCTRL